MSVNSWIVPNSQRVFPASQPEGHAQPRLDLARGERTSFQVAVRQDEVSSLPLRLRVDRPAGCTVRIRRVGYVPVAHHNLQGELPQAGPDLDGVGHVPGYVPDPLFPEDGLDLPAGETHAFWIDVRSSRQARPGVRSVRVSIEADGVRGAARLRQDLRIYPLQATARRGLRLTNWFYADALIDWYGTDLFDARFWTVCEAYFTNMAAHGQDTVYVPVFTPPLDGVKRPTQLLKVAKSGASGYRFDWSDVTRYVRLAKRCGLRHFEFVHLFSQWGVEHALRIYHGQGADERLLWPPRTKATSTIYRGFLAQYLPALKRFVEREKIADKSFFHLSDEPHEEHLAAYRRARTMLRDLAPWMPVMDALSNIDYAREGLTDLPIPSVRKALDFIDEDITCWSYYCCHPRGPYIQRLMDTPPAKILMHGLLLYRWPVRGFLHWGYNYWYRRGSTELIDPFTVSDAAAWHTGWAYGDTFMVYPGPDGPIDSLRWELFAESLQDYALLEQLGIERDDPMLRSLRSYADFPKRASWRRDLRRRLLAR